MLKENVMRRWRHWTGTGRKSASPTLARSLTALGLAAIVLGTLPLPAAQAVTRVVGGELASGDAGTNIGNAAQLTGETTGSLSSSTSDDWWVIYPAKSGDPVSVMVKNTTSASRSCNALVASLDPTNGTSDPLEGATLGGGASQQLSGSMASSDRYFVEIKVASCQPSAGEPVTYDLTLNDGGGGTAPSPAAGSIAAGTSIGSAWPPLQGHTSYTGTIPSDSSDHWYVLYKKPDTKPATIRVEDTTVSGTVSCANVQVSLDAANASDDVVVGADLGDNSAQTFSLPGRSSTDTSGLYFVEVTSPGCPQGGNSYRVEPEPAKEWLNPAKVPLEKAKPGGSVDKASPPLKGATSYDGTVTSSTEENWYVLYKKPGSSPASVRVENTTVAGSASCAILSASLDGADGADDVVTGVTLGDNSAATLSVTDPGGPDYLGRYYLEISASGCPSGGVTYRIEPEPGSGWLTPERPSSAPLPSGSDKKAAGGPLKAGVDYEATLPAAQSQDWVFLRASGSTPLTISVQDTTKNLDNCQEETVTLLDSDGTVSGANLGDDDGTELIADTAQTYYLEISTAGDCPPDDPLTASVTLTPPRGVCSCSCGGTAGQAAPAAGKSGFEIDQHRPGGGTVAVQDKTTTVGVGEPIDLSVACAPGGTTPTAPFKWALPASARYPVALASYDIQDGPHASATLTKVTKFNQDKFSFYLLKPGSYRVTVTASGGKQAHATFNVKAPTAEFSATTCKAALNTLYTYQLTIGPSGPPRLSLGLNNQCVTNPGLAWKAKATLTDRVLPAGDLAVVQLVNGTIKHSTQPNACVRTDGTWEADSAAFYPTNTDHLVLHGHTVTGFTTGPDLVGVSAGGTSDFGGSDAPNVPLHGGGTWTGDLQFTDYLMYRPNYQATGFGHIGIWVALRQLSWAFKGSASLDAGHWKLGKVTANPNPVNSAANPTEPQFSKVVTAGACQ